MDSTDLHDLFHQIAQGGLLRRLLLIAREEDLGPAGQPGDITSLCCIEPHVHSRANLVARAPGVIAGLAFLPELIELFAPEVRTLPRARDGDLVFQGHIVLELDGPLVQILALERTMLNLVGRLSGIASRTRRFVDALPPDCPARIYDTRKTTPGLRLLEKYAVRAGGGRSHRMGLHDAVLIKDNHIAGVPDARLAAFILAASHRARSMTPRPAFIQVEVDSLDQFDQLLTLPAGTIDIVLLDNMGPDLLRRAVAMRNAARPGLELEASGGVTLETLPALASTGVDRISIGGLTHSAIVLDVALDVVGQA